jgi:hypothetical protein
MPATAGMGTVALGTDAIGTDATGIDANDSSSRKKRRTSTERFLDEIKNLKGSSRNKEEYQKDMAMSIKIGGKLEYYSNRLREAKEDGEDEEIQKYQKRYLNWKNNWIVHSLNLSLLFLNTCWMFPFFLFIYLNVNCLVFLVNILVVVVSKLRLFFFMSSRFCDMPCQISAWLSNSKLPLSCAIYAHYSLLALILDQYFQHLEFWKNIRAVR